MPGRIAGTISKRNSFMRVGRNDIVISNRSFDIERNASSTWNVNAGSVVITMMNKMRNSMPWNQMMANTTQDSAGMPWKNVSTGAMKFSAVLELADDQRQHAAEDEGAEQAGEDAPGGEQHVDQERAGDQNFDGARDDFRHRRKQKGRKQRRQNLPKRRQREHAGGRLQDAHGARVHHCIGFS